MCYISWYTTFWHFVVWPNVLQLQINMWLWPKLFSLTFRINLEQHLDQNTHRTIIQLAKDFISFYGSLLEGMAVPILLHGFHHQNSLIFGGIALHSSDLQIPKRQFSTPLPIPSFRLDVWIFRVYLVRSKILHRLESPKIYFKTIRPDSISTSESEIIWI